MCSEVTLGVACNCAFSSAELLLLVVTILSSFLNITCLVYRPESFDDCVSMSFYMNMHFSAIRIGRNWLQ